MSEKTNNKTCPICGAELLNDARFCSLCGAKTEDVSEQVEATQAASDRLEAEQAKNSQSSEKAEATDGLSLKGKSENSKTKTGTVQVKLDHFELTDDVKVEKLRPNIFEYISKFLSNRLAGCVAVFLTAVILTGLWFVPFAHSKNDSYNIKFSCAKVLELTVRSFFFMDDSELAETWIYEDIAKATSEKKIFEKTFAMTLMRHDSPIRLSILLTGVLSLAYFVLCILLLVFSTIDFIIGLIALGKKDFKLNVRSGNLLFSICCIVPLLTFSFLRMCQFGTDNFFAQYSTGGVGLSVGGIFVIFISFLCGGIVCLQKAYSLKKPAERFYTRTKIKNIVCGAIALLFIISVFLPCINIDIYNERTGEIEQTVSVSPDQLHEISDGEMRYYSKTSSSSFAAIIADMVEQVDDGDIDKGKIGAKMLYPIIFGCGRLDIRVLFVFIIFVTLMTLVFGGLLLRSILLNIFFNKSNDSSITAYKVLTFMSTVLYTLLFWILSLITASSFNGQLSAFMDASVGAGPILMLICIIALLVFPRNPKEYKYVDRDYDNADVSYAPYVVDKEI